jgi:hypothetical protein
MDTLLLALLALSILEFMVILALDNQRTELMKQRARMNTFIDKSNPIRSRASPLVPEAPEVSFDFTIFDLEDTL